MAHSTTLLREGKSEIGRKLVGPGRLIWGLGIGEITDVFRDLGK